MTDIQKKADDGLMTKRIETVVAKVRRKIGDGCEKNIDAAGD